MRPVEKSVKKAIDVVLEFCQVDPMYKSWLRLWPFIRPHKKPLIIAIIFGVLLAILSVVLPVMVQAIMAGFKGDSIEEIDGIAQLIQFLNLDKDHWIRHIDHKALVYYTALCLPIYFAIYGTVRFTHHFLVKYIGEKVMADIRVRLMEKFMELDVLYLSRHEAGSGGLLSRTLNDTLVLQQGLQYYGDLFREPIVGVVLISYMFFLNWKITLGCFVFLPVFMGVIRYVSKSLKKFGYQSQETLEEVTKTLKEGLDGVRVIQSFNLQEQVKGKFSHQVREYLSKRKKIIKREESGSPINEWFASILVCGICIFQSDLIGRGESDIASFIAFLFAAGSLDKPVKKTQQAIIRIQQNIVAVERLGEVLDSQTKVDEVLEPQVFPDQWDEIQFKDVSFSYEDKKVVEDINLSIKKGEVVALVGASGAGKSTLVGLLQRFFDPQEGTIEIGSTDIRNVKTYDLREKIGYVTQDVFLFDDTIENNIWFGNLSRDKSEILEAAKMANAYDFVNNIEGGFQSKVGERGGKLSGGEKQRISIARAVFKDPPILILDEATSALDSASEQEVQKGIEGLLRGRTALVIAHRLSTIINSDRIIVMKDGKIVETGSHEELLSQKGEYANFYELQYQ